MIRLSIAVFSLLFTVGATAATVVPSPPRVAAKAYILIDAASGKVLVEENADVPLPPASLTKMMTAYVLASEMAAGRVRPDDMVTAPYCL